MSNFTDVCLLNGCYGRPVGDLNNPNYKLLENQFKLVLSEVDETKTALEDKDVKELIDGLADILVTTYGMGHVLGVDLDKVMQEVQRANMSKICEGEVEALETVVAYNAKGIDNDNLFYEEVGDSTNLFVVKVEQECTDNGGTKYTAGKVLKNVNWEEPNYSDLENYRLEQ